MQREDFNRWSRIAAKLSADVPCGEDGVWLSDQLSLWLVTTAVPERRDRAVRQAAELVAPHLSRRRKALELVAAFGRYEIRWKRVDRHLELVPPEYVGTAKQFLFEARRAARGDMPTSARQFARILARD